MFEGEIELRVRVPPEMHDRILALSEGTTKADVTRDALSLALAALEADAPDRPHAIARAADARARLAGLRRLRDEVDVEIAAAVSAMVEAERAAE